jgi:hypothetical protein
MQEEKQKWQKGAKMAIKGPFAIFAPFCHFCFIFSAKESVSGLSRRSRQYRLCKRPTNKWPQS